MDIERMGDAFSCSHAACLAAQLPRGARCRVADDPHEAWGEDVWIMRRALYALETIRWAMARGDGEKPPEPLPYPGMEGDMEAAREREKRMRKAVDEAFGMG